MGDKLVCASLNGSVEGNGWYLYGVLHDFVADVKSTIGKRLIGRVWLFLYCIFYTLKVFTLFLCLD